MREADERERESTKAIPAHGWVSAVHDVCVDLEKTRFMFVSHSGITEERTWLWWWSVGDVVDSVASGYARTKAEAQRCAEAVATSMGWVKP